MSDEDVFDPNDPEYDSSGGGQYKDLKTSGTYLLGTRACLKHDTTQNGKLYTRLAFVVIAGPHKGESFVDRVFRSPTSYKRLAAFCRAMRITEKWNPAKNAEVERVMLGRAFKASTEMNNNDFMEVKFPETDFTEDELAAMIEWERGFKREVKKKLDDRLDDFGDPGPQAPDDFGPSDSFGDDDIPF